MNSNLIADVNSAEDVTVRTVTITSAIMPGWWQAQDTSGRKFRVAGTGLYRRGETVRTVDDQIIERSGSIKTPSVYEV